MSDNRKLTDWFTPSSSSSQRSSASSKSALGVAQPSKPGPVSKPTSTSSQSGSKASTTRKPSATDTHASITKPHARAKAPAPVVIDIGDSSFEMDSSIELISTPTFSQGPTSSQTNSLTRTGASVQRNARPMPSKLRTAARPEQSSRGKSPVVIDISSDALTPSTLSPRSVITLSDDSSDFGSISLKRANTGASIPQLKKRRTSSTKGTVHHVVTDASSDSAEEKHVEIKLSMPVSKSKAQDVDSSGEGMDWAPTPSASQTRSTDSPAKKLQASSVDSTPDRTTPDVTMSDANSDDPVPKIRGLPRRARLTTTPPTSVSPPGAPQTAVDIIARMKTEILDKDISSSDDDLAAGKALAVALAEESSDNDDDDEFVFGGIKQLSKPSSNIASSSRPRLLSSSSLSSAPALPEDEDVAMTDADDSDGTPAIRRSSRVIMAPKPLAPLITSTPKPRKKQSEFDRLFAEDTRRKRNRGGVDGYQKADTLVAAHVHSSAGEEESSDDEQKAGSVAGRSNRSGLSHSHRSRTGSVLPDSDDEMGSAEENGGESDVSLTRVGDLAQRLLGDEDTVKLRSLIQVDPTNGLKPKRRLLTDDGEVRFVRASRRLWDKAVRSVEQAPTRWSHLDDPLVTRVFKAAQDERLLEALLHLQRWDSYRGRTDLAVIRELVSLLLSSIICSADAALGDCAMLKLIQLIQDHSTNLATISLSLQNVIAAACSTLGARPEALKELLVTQNNPLSFGQLVQRDAVVARGKIHRALCATRYIRLLETLVSTGALNPEELSDLIQFSILIACDPSSTPELERQVTTNLHNAYTSNLDLDTELLICKSLVRAFSDASHSEKLFAASLIPSYSVSSCRLQSWLAYGFLAPHEADKWTSERFANPPPYTSIVAQVLDKGKTPGRQQPLFDLQEGMEPLRVPDFEDVACQVQLLDIMFSDLRAFIEYSRALGKARSKPHEGEAEPLSTLSGPTGKKASGPLDHLINGLKFMHDNIDDGRAANLDKTRLKQFIHRLQVRLSYERQSALEFAAHRDGAVARMNLDSHFSRNPPPSRSLAYAS